MAGKMPFTFGPASGPCAVCGQPGRACGRCLVDFYCGKEHQEEDRARHRQGCGSLSLQRSAQLGRYVVAKKDIPAGTVLMRELPLAVIPKPPSPAVRALCVGCCRVLALHELRCCARCGWPACDEACARHPRHRAECAAFQRAGFKIKDVWNQPLYVWHALAGLRAVLASEATPVAELQAELPAPDPQDMLDPLLGSLSAQSRAECALLSGEAAAWLTNTVGVGWLGRDKLLRGVRVVIINALDLDTTTDYAAVALYKGLSMLEHSCVANTSSGSWRSDDLAGVPDDVQRVVFTTRAVRRGEHLSLPYVSDPLQALADRRLTLLRWGFVCRCALCADPTQAGLHLHGWLCALCRGRGRRSLVTLDEGRRWHCEGCGWRGAHPVGGLLDVLWLGPVGDLDEASGQAEAGRLERRLLAPFGVLASEEPNLPLQALEALLQEASATLHPTHHALLRVKKALVQCRPSYKDGLGEARRLAGYCRELLAAADALAPGDSRLRSASLLRLAELDIAQMMCVVGSVRARPRLWAEYKDDAKSLAEELVGLLVELKKSTVLPYKKKVVDCFQKMFNSARKDLPAA